MLGSNIGEREKFLQQAVVLLSRNCGKILRLSAVYESEPWGFDYPVWFLNQAVEIETTYGAQELLRAIHEIEQSLGRTRKVGTYQARTIDIDILFYDNHVINMPELTIPHPQIADRMFVLEPLSELVPNMIHPVLNLTINDLKKNCTDKSMVKRFTQKP